MLFGLNHGVFVGVIANLESLDPEKVSDNGDFSIRLIHHRFHKLVNNGDESPRALSGNLGFTTTI